MLVPPRCTGADRAHPALPGGQFTVRWFRWHWILALAARSGTLANQVRPLRLVCTRLGRSSVGGGRPIMPIHALRWSPVGGGHAVRHPSCPAAWGHVRGGAPFMAGDATHRTCTHTRTLRAWPRSGFRYPPGCRLAYVRRRRPRRLGAPSDDLEPHASQGRLGVPRHLTARHLPTARPSTCATHRTHAHLPLVHLTQRRRSRWASSLVEGVRLLVAAEIPLQRSRPVLAPRAGRGGLTGTRHRPRGTIHTHSAGLWLVTWDVAPFKPQAA